MEKKNDNKKDKNTNRYYPDNLNSYSQLKLFYLFNEIILKEYCLPITNYLKDFIKEDSIILADENFNSIDKTTREYFKFILDDLESAFIKLNLSSGSDCYFMVNKLRCSNIDEILILIKSSTKLQENLIEIISEKEEDNLINNSQLSMNKLFLKKWYKIETRKEFRIVFYKNEILICQRYCDTFFDYSINEIEENYKTIKEFFEKKFNYNLFETEAIVYQFGEGFKIELKNQKLNYLDFHSITKEDLENDLIYVDIIIQNNKKIKIIDIITEKQRLRTAFKLDDYDIKIFLPLLFELYKKSNIYSQPAQVKDSLEIDCDYYFVERENAYFEKFIKEYLIEKKEKNNVSKILFIDCQNKIIAKDENFNKFPQELIDNPSNMLQFIEKLNKDQ